MYYMFEWLYATTALLALWCIGQLRTEVRHHYTPRNS